MNTKSKTGSGNSRRFPNLSGLPVKRSNGKGTRRAAVMGVHHHAHAEHAHLNHHAIVSVGTTHGDNAPSLKLNAL